MPRTAIRGKTARTISIASHHFGSTGGIGRIRGDSRTTKGCENDQNQHPEGKPLQFHKRNLQNPDHFSNPTNDTRVGSSFEDGQRVAASKRSAIGKYPRAACQIIPIFRTAFGGVMQFSLQNSRKLGKRQIQFNKLVVAITVSIIMPVNGVCRAVRICSCRGF